MTFKHWDCLYLYFLDLRRALYTTMIVSDILTPSWPHPIVQKARKSY